MSAKSEASQRLGAALAHELLVEQALKDRCGHDQTLMIIYERGRRATEDRVRALKFALAKNTDSPPPMGEER